MTDALLRWGIDGGDVQVELDDLSHDEGLVTAVLVSLFSDARAPADPRIPPTEQDLRGWWPDDEEDRHGSLLWLLEREKSTTETANRAREYARVALTWLVEDGVASALDVAAEFVSRDTLNLRVSLTRGRSSRWASAWEALKGLHVRVGTVFLQVSAS